MTRPLSRLCAGIFALLITSSAWGQVVLPAPGLPLSGGGTITPSYAGPNALSNTDCRQAPANMQVAATHCFGYGTTYEEQGQLILSTNSSINNAGQNMFGLEQFNVNAFAAMTFRAPNINSAIASDIYEHGGLGYIPPLNGGAGAAIYEASTLPNWLTQGTCSTTLGSFTLTCTGAQGVAGNTVSGPGQIFAHITGGAGTTSITMDVAAQSTTTNQTYNFGGISHAPAPEFDIMQTGGVDTSGVTLATCSTVLGSTTLTCSTNGGTNGQYIWGTGTTYETTVSSGGGTTSITMSQAANSTKTSQPYAFNTSPVVLQRRVIDASPLGCTNFRDFVNGVVLCVDRYHDFIGIKTTTPAFPLDVNGAARVTGQLNLTGALSQASWTTTGVGLVLNSGPYTDTTGTGTIAVEAIHAITSPTLNATNAGVTVTNLATLYVSPPIAGTNVTATNLWAAYINGRAFVTGTLQAGGINSFGAAATINVNSNFVTQIGSGTTNAAVTVGGASNSTTLGSPTITTPNVTTGTPTASLCLDASNNIIKKTTTGACV